MVLVTIHERGMPYMYDILISDDFPPMFFKRGLGRDRETIMVLQQGKETKELGFQISPTGLGYGLNLAHGVSPREKA